MRYSWGTERKYENKVEMIEKSARRLSLVRLSLGETVYNVKLGKLWQMRCDRPASSRKEHMHAMDDGSTSKVSDPSPIIILTAMAHPGILNGKTFAGNISNLANENLKNIKNYRSLKKMQFSLTLSVSSVLHKEYISILERTASPFVFRRKHSPNLSLLCLQHTALPVCLYNCRHCRQREVGRVLPPEDEGGGCPF